MKTLINVYRYDSDGIEDSMDITEYVKDEVMYKRCIYVMFNKYRDDHCYIRISENGEDVIHLDIKSYREAINDMDAQLRELARAGKTHFI